MQFIKAEVSNDIISLLHNWYGPNLGPRKDNSEHGISVIYWPPTRALSNKKRICVNNRWIQSKISVDGLNWVRIGRHRKQVDVKQWYNPGATGSQWVGDQSLESVVAVRNSENQLPADVGPPGPRLSSPAERERSAAIARRAGGQYVAVLVNLHLTSHIITLS